MHVRNQSDGASALKKYKNISTNAILRFDPESNDKSKTKEKCYSPAVAALCDALRRLLIMIRGRQPCRGVAMARSKSNYKDIGTNTIITAIRSRDEGYE